MTPSMNVIISIGARDTQRDAYPVQIQHEGKPLADDWIHIDRQALLENEHKFSAHDYGMELCDTLLTKKLDRIYQRLIGQATVETAIRVQLVIHPDAPELHALPWERLFHIFGNAETPISIDARTPFSRFLVSGAGDQPPVRECPLRILVAMANPTNLPDTCPPLDVEGEVENLVDLLTHSDGRVQGTLLAGRSQLSTELQARLVQQGWTLVEGVTSWQAIQRHLPGQHILHILAHGQFSKDTAYLLLEHEGSDKAARGSMERIADDAIITGLTGVHPLPHLVFLAACDSAKRPETGTATTGANPFVGLAPKLVEAGVPAIVAMQDEVPTDLAHTLAADFYRRLFEHGQVDLALNEARNLIYKNNQFEWAIPVLFQRLSDGQLFAKSDEHLEPPGRVMFDDFIKRHTELFAGRDTELQDLEHFMADPVGGYFLITAGAGLGKTALMANLVERHPDVAYHFFTPILSESLDETWFLRNVLEQVSPWYEAGALATGQLDELRKRYHALWREDTFKDSHTLVLDGLDEVASWDLSRYLPWTLPPGAHLILTVRDVGQDAVADYSLPAKNVREMALLGLTREGVQAVLEGAGGEAVQFAKDNSLLDQMCRVTAYDTEKPELGADTLLVRFLAEDAATGQLRPDKIAKLPQGMKSYLDDWLQAILSKFAEEGEPKTKRQAAIEDLAFTLAAALGSIGKVDLEAVNPSLVSARVQDYVATVVEDVKRIIVRDPRGDYTLLHPRLRDYLRQTLKTGPYIEKLLDYCAEWPQHKSRYALTYYARHLVEAATAVDPTRRHEWTQTLVKLVTDKHFQDVYLGVVQNFRSLYDDLQRGLDMVARDTTPEALPLLVDNALSLVRFRRERLRPEHFFDLAAQGDIAGAKRMIDLFEMDTKWQHIVLLEIAWLASAAGSGPARDQARALYTEVSASIHELPQEDQRYTLLLWIEADLEGKPWPQGNLPQASSPMELHAKLDAAGGVSSEADVSPEMLMSIEGINWNFIERGIEYVDEIEEMSEEMFIAYYTGPGLVALTVEDPQTGESLLKQYLNVHSAYTYANYRFGSSWALLRSILQHPNPIWVREHVRSLLIAALGGSSLEFEEGLPLTVLALRAGGCAKAAKELTEYTTHIQQEAKELDPGRGRGDTWGRYKRLLTTLAQAQTVTGVGVGVPSHELLNDALRTHYGYAGYQAPACLTLAEAIRICRPAQEDTWITWALESAQQAAHNIQEGAFCARTTARVNAMRQQWWPGSDLDVQTEIAALRTDPRLPHFSALHYIGHTYQGRGDPPQSFPLPNKVRYGDTLAVLASAFQRDMPEFLRLNRDWDPEHVIPPGTPIHVPDPGMVSLLAARLAAEVLIVTGLTQEERVALIRSLVPLAVANPTALDTVLARLLLAEHPVDPATLTELKKLAPMPVDAQTDLLQGELTVVVP